MSLGGDQGFSSAFSALAGAASAARTVRDTRARGAMDTERELMALPEKDDLRAPATFIAGATRAVDIVKDAIVSSNRKRRARRKLDGARSNGSA